MAAPRWETVAMLADPVRRALYEYVRRQDHAVTREDAGAALAISRTLTAFHLDKLVDAGLLRTRYEAPPGPRGRGRTPKVYEATEDGLVLTVPPRQYELIGRILADAVATRPDDASTAALARAHELGRTIGTELGPSAADPAVRPGQVDPTAALAQLGFEPRPDPGGAGVVLGNCPFQSLAAYQPELICGLNVALVTGLLAGLGVDRVRTELHPQPPACCVRVVPAGS